MKIVNVMNFVRRIDEREENSTERLLAFTAEELRLVNDEKIENTFLLQYDALCDKDFVNLFKSEATERTELGLWYEIVEPQTTACGLPYRSENGWKWDWHIVPGYPMAYTPAERELLIDEAMRKFRETFGHYPKTVAGWVIDTYTLNYLAERYDISAAAICRDQANTDAYTLLGGYFNQAYYPSKNNIFTPAQSRKTQTNIPVFRLLGPCPVHNYDDNKYSSEEFRALGRKSACFTLEPCWYMGSRPEIVKWMFDSYYGEESLGFAYAQIGQENSFLSVQKQVINGLRMQIEQIKERGDVEFKKMCDTGEWFKKTYESTPATAVVALDNFDTTDVQSVYYDCKNYTANLFRFENKLFIRSLYLFDDRVEDKYVSDTCSTFDAIYENMPIIDTMTAPESDKKRCGLEIDVTTVPFKVEKAADGVLKVYSPKTAVTFYENCIEITAKRLILYRNSVTAEVENVSNGLILAYKGRHYLLIADGAEIISEKEKITFICAGDKITLFPKKI